jgi:hypothetical protein
MSATRIVPNGAAVTRIVPTPDEGGATPAPPTPSVTLPNDTTLVTNLDVTGAQAVDEYALAPGWSY